MLTSNETYSTILSMAHKRAQAVESSSNFIELQKVIASQLLPYDQELEHEKQILAKLVETSVLEESRGTQSMHQESIARSTAESTPEAVVEQFKAMFAAGKISMRSGTLPEHATTELLHWFLDHIVHPYPDTKERQKLASKCGLEGSCAGSPAGTPTGSHEAAFLQGHKCAIILQI